MGSRATAHFHSAGKSQTGLLVPRRWRPRLLARSPVTPLSHTKATNLCRSPTPCRRRIPSHTASPPLVCSSPRTLAPVPPSRCSEFVDDLPVTVRAIDNHGPHTESLYRPLDHLALIKRHSGYLPMKPLFPAPIEDDHAAQTPSPCANDTPLFSWPSTVCPSQWRRDQSAFGTMARLTI